MDFLREDLLTIEKEAKKVIKEEIKTRIIFPVDTNFPNYALEVGFDIFDIKGSAQILSKSADAHNLPLVGETRQRTLMPVYSIATGIKYTQAERQAVAALNKNASKISLDLMRVATARRFIEEELTKLAFNGKKEFNINGILSNSYYAPKKGTKQSVSNSGSGSTNADKRKWANKSPKQILEDIRIALETSSANGLFPGKKMIVLPYKQFFSLNVPYSDYSSSTVIEWIKKNEEVEVIWTNALQKDNNGLNEDCFLVFPKKQEYLKLAIIQDSSIGDPVYDVMGTSIQSLFLSTAGVFVYHPACLYLGVGI